MANVVDGDVTFYGAGRIAEHRVRATSLEGRMLRALMR